MKNGQSGDLKRDGPCKAVCVRDFSSDRELPSAEGSVDGEGELWTAQKQVQSQILTRFSLVLVLRGVF